jgi:quercetin dioxygenase-like cupin family protein
VARYAIRRLDEIPQIPPDDEDDFRWYPLQHYFGLTAFGVNVYVATSDGGDLLGTHSETESNQEELYLVTSGTATFTIEGEEIDVPAVGVVAVPDPTVVRGAVAKTAGTTVVAIGGESKDRFETSWQPKWFENVPQVE